MGTRATKFGIAAAALAALAALAVGRRWLTGSPAEDAPPPVGRAAAPAPASRAADDVAATRAFTSEAAAAVGRTEFADPEVAAAADAGPWRIRGHVVLKAPPGAAPTPLPDVPLRLESVPGLRDSLARATRRATARTARDGSFAFGLPEPAAAATLRVVVEGDRYSGRSSALYAEPGAPPPEPLEIVASAYDGAIVGVVTDENGAPLPQAAVGWNDRVATDAEGRYRLPFVAGRPQTFVAASAPGRATEFKAASTDRTIDVRLDFALRPGGVVEGLVRGPDGKPLPGAEAVASAGFSSSSATTDADGRFRLEGFALDDAVFSQSVVVASPGCVPASKEPSFQDGVCRLTFDLVAGAPLGGAVVDASGAPVAGAVVALVESFGGSGQTVATGRDGRFHFAAVPPGDVALTGTAPRRVEARTQLRVPPGGRNDARLAFGPSRGAGGVVVDRKGAPRVGAYVVAVRGYEFFGGAVKTGDDGRFVAEGLPEGALEFEVFGAGLLRKRYPATAGSTEHRLVAEACGVLAGVATDAATGEPIRRFTVRVGDADDEDGSTRPDGLDAILFESGRTFSGDDGAWSLVLDTFAVGDAASVEVSAEGYATARIPRLVSAATPQPEAGRTALARAASAGGVVLTATGEPAVGAEIFVRAAASAAKFDDAPRAARRDAVTGADGRFLCKNLPAGEVAVRVGLPNRAPFWWGPVALVAGAPPAEWRIVLPTAGRIRGTILGARGAAEAGAVALLAHDPAAARFVRLRTTSDAEGRFVFEGLAPGVYDVEAGGDGSFAARTVQARVVGDETVDVRVGALGPATARVRIVSDLELPPTLKVFARPLPEPGDATPRAGATGTARDRVCEIDGLDPGRYQFTVFAAAAELRVTGSVAATLAPGVVEVELRAVQQQW